MGPVERMVRRHSVGYGSGRLIYPIQTIVKKRQRRKHGYSDAERGDQEVAARARIAHREILRTHRSFQPRQGHV